MHCLLLLVVLLPSLTLAICRLEVSNDRPIVDKCEDSNASIWATNDSYVHLKKLNSSEIHINAKKSAILCDQIRFSTLEIQAHDSKIKLDINDSRIMLVLNRTAIDYLRVTGCNKFLSLTDVHRHTLSIEAPKCNIETRDRREIEEHQIIQDLESPSHVIAADANAVVRNVEQSMSSTTNSTDVQTPAYQEILFIILSSLTVVLLLAIVVWCLVIKSSKEESQQQEPKPKEKSPETSMKTAVDTTSSTQSSSKSTRVNTAEEASVTETVQDSSASVLVQNSRRM